MLDAELQTVASAVRVEEGSHVLRIHHLNRSLPRARGA